jgi:hypothetical protein
MTEVKPSCGMAASADASTELARGHAIPTVDGVHPLTTGADALDVGPGVAADAAFLVADGEPVIAARAASGEIEARANSTSPLASREPADSNAEAPA